MTLHEDVARINEGDTVTAEYRHNGAQYEITGTAQKWRHDLNLGPFAIAYEVDSDLYGVNANLLRIVAHTPKPAPLYANRPDIKSPRPFDVVMAEGYGEAPLTFWSNRWRAHGGSAWETSELLEVGPLTLVGAAIP